MSEELLPPVAADQMRISVEVGDEYEPGERVAAALAELRDALQEDEDGDDVAGFLSLNFTQFSFQYDSLQGTFPSRGFQGEDKDVSFHYKGSPPYNK